MLTKNVRPHCQKRTGYYSYCSFRRVTKGDIPFCHTYKSLINIIRQKVYFPFCHWQGDD